MGRPRKKRTSSKGRIPAGTRDEVRKDGDKASLSQGKAEAVAKGTEADKAEAEAKAKNDPAWYAKDLQLLADASRITFSETFGKTFNTFKDGYTAIPLCGVTTGTHKHIELQNAGLKPAYGTLATYHIFPSVGTALNRKDPVNVAANMLYTHVRYTNSGRKNYDPADLMIYALTIAELYSFVAFCQKIYACIYTYSAKNTMFPYTILKTLRIDPSNLMHNIADFRGWLNSIINKISAYAIPTDITYFPLKIQMYSSLYMENNDGNIKDQMYHVCPEAFLKFELDANKLGSLVPKYWRPANTTGFTVAEIEAFGDDLISSIEGDEDFGLISGDIIRAFEGKLIGLESQGDSAYLMPVYDELMLEKFRNADVAEWFRDPKFTINYGGLTDYKLCSIRQNGTGDIVHQFGVVVPSDSTSPYEISSMAGISNCARVALQNYLNVESVEPDPGLIVEATRWKNVIEKGAHVVDDDGDDNVYFKVTGGTEVVTGIELTYVDWSSGGSNYVSTQWHQVTFDTRTCSTYGGSVAALYGAGQNYERASFIAAHFRYIPISYRMSNTSFTSPTLYVAETLWDGALQNYTRIEDKFITRLHEVALLSLLSIPGVAKFIVNGGSSN